MSDPIRLEITADEAGLRVDQALVRRFAGLGRAAAKALVEEGGVRLDGRRVKKGDRVAEGSVIELARAPSPSVAEALADESLALTILHEDASLVVVDKPAGVPSHPLRADERGTIASALVARYPEMRAIGHSPREPGLVHRLDVDTSGVLVAARTEAAFAALVASLRAGRWDKRYRALVAGQVAGSLTIEAAIASHPSDPRRVLVAGDPLEAARHGARIARSEVSSIERLRATTLVEVVAHVAVRHQVRAHLAFVGHPLVGDVLYGGPEEPALGRHFLHASALVLPHPQTGERLVLGSPLPAELEAAVARAR